MKILVIGGGPAGMMAAIAAKTKDNQVILIEKMKSLGRKLLITGKGRCNITSSLPIEDFIKNTPGNGKFLYSCYQQYTNKDIIKFLKEDNKNKQKYISELEEDNKNKQNYIEALEDEKKRNNEYIEKLESKKNLKNFWKGK